MPTEWFAVWGQRLDRQGGTGGEEHLYDADDDEVDDVIGYDDDEGGNDVDDDETWVESGAQASAYTGLELVARVERSIPLLHKIIFATPA